VTKPSIELSDSLFSTGSGIKTAFPLGAKGEKGFGKFAEASPPAPDFTAESSRNQFSQKLGKKFDFREEGGGYADERKMGVRPKLSFGLRSGRC
jgi:hypothetical protein